MLFDQNISCKSHTAYLLTQIKFSEYYVDVRFLEKGTLKLLHLFYDSVTEV